jgi:hypothetical protein
MSFPHFQLDASEALHVLVALATPVLDKIVSKGRIKRMLINFIFQYESFRVRTHRVQDFVSK